MKIGIPTLHLHFARCQKGTTNEVECLEQVFWDACVEEAVDGTSGQNSLEFFSSLQFFYYFSGEFDLFVLTPTLAETVASI